MLLLLDNAATEGQVLPLLPGTAGCQVLVTSRRRLGGLDNARPLSVDVLPLHDAAALFVNIAGRAQPVDTELIDEIADLCGSLPLAIHIAAARLRARPVWTLSHLADRLRDQHRRLTELDIGHRSVSTAFQVSYQHLTAEQRRMFRSLGLHPGPEIDSTAAAALAGITVAAADRLLDDLTDAHLLQEKTTGRYRFHDLIRAHATQLAADEEPAAITRLLDHYLRMAATAMDALYPYESARRPRVDRAGGVLDTDTAATWLDTEHENLMAVAGLGCRDHTIALAVTLSRHLYVRGHHTQAVALHTLALTGSRADADRDGELVALNGLGWILAAQGQYGPAVDCFEQALGLAQAIDDHAGELRALNGLGGIHYTQGRYEPAADCFAQASHLACALEDHVGELDARRGLGDICRLQAGYEQAADHYQRALSIARVIGHQPGALRILWGLADIHRLRGHYDKAVDCNTEALNLARATGNRPGEELMLRGLGVVLSLKGRFEEAIELLERSRDLARAIGGRVGELHALWNLGEAYRLQGRYDRAFDHFDRALTLGRELGDANGEFEALLGLGNTSHATGAREAAVIHYRRALVIATELNQRHDQARVHNGLARTAHDLGDVRLGLGHWKRALAIFTELGTPEADEIREHLTALGQRA